MVGKGLGIALAAISLLALALLAVPPAALAGGGMPGGGHNRYATGGVCKSGKHVHDTKLCKENGGKY
ncbi:MAG: hypothetical protein OJF62_002237 [Pseudolabrys sp.]|jgi:hypothetical protein|nr:hypothetical protein [Pseudolabrys sp.]